MKVLLSWLRDYTDIPWAARELADRLTMAGLEVESLIPAGNQVDGVVVGVVLTVAPHPNADRLSVCTVEVGDATLNIVCGAPNVAAGQRVPVAQAGTTLPNGLRIRSSKIRGVASDGMICSEAELGLSDRGDEIMVLGPDAPIGRALTDVLGGEETVLDIDVKPNRPDCMSLVGIAREVAALARRPLRPPAIAVPESGPPVTGLGAVRLDDPAGCPRFAGRVITGVRVGPSPVWLARRLDASGVRSINNVVDVTNYVMLELGQPLHAYDRDRLAGHEIIVRAAADGERFTTLDGVERTLTPEVLMIADRDHGIGVAGIMGGLDTEITGDTTAVFLEGACFDPARIRRGSKRLGLSTEASRRFERGVDPDLQAAAVDRGAQLIADLAGGTVATGRIDQRGASRSRRTIHLRLDRVNRVLGTTLSAEDVTELLRALQFPVRGNGDLTVEVPSFRVDVTREIDLIEEVVRLYGYGRLTPRLSSPSDVYRARVSQQTAESSEDARQRQKERGCQLLRETLIGWGSFEVLSHSLVHPDDLTAVDPSAAPLIVANPLSPELSAMRTTLSVPILGVIRWNVNRKTGNIRVFEIGRVFRARPAGGLPDEPLHLCVAMTGQRETLHWSRRAAPVDFFDLKGVVEGLLGQFALDKVRSIPYDGAWTLFDPEQSASILVGEERIGGYGAVSRPILERFDIAEPVFLAEVDCEPLIRHGTPVRTARPLPKYPATERDLAVVVPESVDHQSVAGVIAEACGPLLERLDLFDVYRGPQIPAGKKSLAYALRYRSPERTLTDDEVSSLQAQAVDRLGRVFGAVLRA